MENQVLIVVLDSELRPSEILALQQFIVNCAGVKVVRTMDRVINDALRDSDKDAK